MKTMLQLKTLQQISNWMLEVALESMDQLAAKETRYHPLVKRVLEHVAEHYREDMNLKTLAYDLNVTPVYLGHLFLRETGEPFTNYLNTVRAEKAKILLKETSLSIKEISQSVGYANTKYFSSVFAKVTGVNPSDYRP
jgi:two-component system response regulator YesN